MKYEGYEQNYERNHVILPGSKDALRTFLNHAYKRKNSISSHSEDALTWSCFDVLRNLSDNAMIGALDEIMEDAYQGETGCQFFSERKYSAEQITVHIGEKYEGIGTEETEVDASIVTPKELIFFEAKLYSTLSLADESKGKPHDQIARKLRVGLHAAMNSSPKREFYFVFLDIAPREKLNRREKIEIADDPKGGYENKWKSAYKFTRYKFGHAGSSSPLQKILEDLDGIDDKAIVTVAERMGWLTWSDLYKTVLRGLVSSTSFRAKHK